MTSSRPCAVIAGLLLGLVLVAPAAAMQPVREPLPTAQGPIASTARSHPFAAAAWQEVPIDLAARDYVEAEYFLRGTANVYGYNPDKSVRIDTPSAPYVNRILVRRPSDPKRFNGKVVVELLNASAAADLSFTWANSADYLTSQGYGYVGVTSKPIAVAKLKTFDPDRYAPLSWANPLPAAKTCANPGPAGLFPGWSTPATEDGLLWDIAAQTGALVRSDRADNPFHGYDVKAVFLTGHSQSGAYVGEYARDFQPILRTPDGKPVFDGFMQTGSAGLSPINQCSQAPPYTDPHVRMASATPLIRIMTLTDFYDYVNGIRPYLLRREDSDAPGDLFRLYEVAGAAHVSPDIARNNASGAERLRAGLSPLDRAVCAQTTPSDFRLGPVFDVALEHLDAWRRGTPPPHAGRILVDRPGAPDARSVLDRDGNVQGGVRTPAIDVPRAAYAGKSDPDPAHPVAGCRTQDHMVPFSPARLKQLYPTREAYLAKLQASVEALRKARWLTDWDAEQILRKAQPPPPG